mgnify:CR=1 FL=1
MFRKHPDVVAIAIVALVMMIASLPRMILSGSPHWAVQPLKLQIPVAERERIRREVREGVLEHKQAVKSALDEARTEVREALRHQ